MFQSAEERDTEGLSPPSYLRVSIYTDMIEQGKQKKKQLYAISWQPCIQTNTHTHSWTQYDVMQVNHLPKCNIQNIATEGQGNFLWGIKLKRCLGADIGFT